MRRARTSPPLRRPWRATSTPRRGAPRPSPLRCSRCSCSCGRWTCPASTRRWPRWRPPAPAAEGGPMRAALWLLVLFAIAVAVALFAGNNQGTITVFWPPYRVDLSLNLVLLLLLATFLFLHAALRALSALFDLPRQALRWRNQQKERSMHALLLDALSHLIAGRFIRARKSAEAALAHEASLTAAGAGAANGAQL